MPSGRWKSVERNVSNASRATSKYDTQVLLRYTQSDLKMARPASFEKLSKPSNSKKHPPRFRKWIVAPSPGGGGPAVERKVNLNCRCCPNNILSAGHRPFWTWNSGRRGFLINMETRLVRFRLQLDPTAPSAGDLVSLFCLRAKLCK